MFNCSTLLLRPMPCVCNCSVVVLEIIYSSALLWLRITTVLSNSKHAFKTRIVKAFQLSATLSGILDVVRIIEMTSECMQGSNKNAFLRVLQLFCTCVLFLLWNPFRVDCPKMSAFTRIKTVSLSAAIWNSRVLTHTADPICHQFIIHLVQSKIILNSNALVLIRNVDSWMEMVWQWDEKTLKTNTKEINSKTALKWKLSKEKDIE